VTKPTIVSSGRQHSVVLREDQHLAGRPQADRHDGWQQDDLVRAKMRAGDAFEPSLDDKTARLSAKQLKKAGHVSIPNSRSAATVTVDLTSRLEKLRQATESVRAELETRERTTE
jgi:hypothetical protein